MSIREQAELLARETEALGISRADSLRCPLCEAEVPGAWTLTASGHPSVATGPVECPRCDFRLDACRHCTHLLPGSPQGGAGQQWSGGDMTFGRCAIYKSSQPVEQTCAPEMARRLKARGYERIRAPLPIADSFFPPDSCTAFEPDRSRLRAGRVPWPDARRVALLRLLALPAAPEARSPEKVPQGDEQWLL